MNAERAALIRLDRMYQERAAIGPLLRVALWLNPRPPAAADARPIRPG
jgi:hypothetical protein